MLYMLVILPRCYFFEAASQNEVALDFLIKQTLE